MGTEVSKLKVWHVVLIVLIVGIIAGILSNLFVKESVVGPNGELGAVKKSIFKPKKA